MMSFKWEIDAGQVLVAAAMLVSVTGYIVSGHNAVGYLAVDVQDTKIKVTELSTQIQGLRNDMANLLVVREGIGQLARRTADLEAHARSTDDGISDIKQRVTRVEATLTVPYRSPRPPP